MKANIKKGYLHSILFYLSESVTVKKACQNEHCCPFILKLLHVMLFWFCPKSISWHWGVSIKEKAWIDCALRCKWQKLNVSTGRCLWWLHPTTILSCCTVQLQRSAAAIECLQDLDLTRRVVFFSGCRGTRDALAEGSQWLLVTGVWLVLLLSPQWD